MKFIRNSYKIIDLATGKKSKRKELFEAINKRRELNNNAQIWKVETYRADDSSADIIKEEWIM